MTFALLLGIVVNISMTFKIITKSEIYEKWHILKTFFVYHYLLRFWFKIYITMLYIFRGITARMYIFKCPKSHIQFCRFCCRRWNCCMFLSVWKHFTIKLGLHMVIQSNSLHQKRGQYS